MEEEKIRIIVDEIVSEVKNYQGEFNPEGLCVFFANNIGCVFEEEDIDYRILTIGEFVDTNYYHEFLLTIPNGEDAFLIDPSFGQFVDNGSKLIKFGDWPATVLKSYENGNKIESELLENGLCKVNAYDVKTYLSSFDVNVKPEDIDFSFEKLMSNSRGMI